MDGQRGFTIPSVLVGVSLSLVALAAFGSFQRFQLRTIRTEANRIDLQTTARNLMDLAIAEIRQAGANPTCAAGIEAISDARQQLLRINADVNGDGVISGSGEQITYEYKFSAGKLERTSGGVTDALLSGFDMNGSRLRYFDGNGVELTAGLTGLPAGQRSSVRKIRFELVLTQNAHVDGNTQQLRVEVASDIDLRNRYFVNALSCS